MGDYDITDRNRVRQVREYARYDRDSAHEVLDADVCVNVTLLAGIVAARSAFNSSMMVASWRASRCRVPSRH